MKPLRLVVITRRFWPTAGGTERMLGNLVGELAKACHRRRMRFGLYYSASDWYQRNPEAPQLAPRDYPPFVEAQLRELLTRYGRVDEIWFDGGNPDLPRPILRKIIRMIHGLQPSCVVNNRGVNDFQSAKPMLGDFVTPERTIPQAIAAKHPFIECCDAMGRKSWGYHADESFWSAPELIRRLSNVASFAGNYLLNVEPQPDGRFRPECVTRLRRIGEWLKANGEAVYDIDACTVLPRDPAEDTHAPLGYSTAKANNLYLHLHTWPLSDAVLAKHVSGDIASAHLLGAKAPLRAEITGEGLTVTGLPETSLSAAPAVIRVRFKRPPQITAPPARGQRRVVELPPGETVILKARDAQFKATNGVPLQRENRFPGGKTSVGHLYRYDAQVWWGLNAGKGGRYLVSADLGANDIQADATFALDIAGCELRGKTRCTGWYDRPERLRLGKMSIKRGKQTLKLKILDMPHGYFADVHGIVLQPI